MQKEDDHEALARLRGQLQSEHAFDVRVMTNRSVILGTGNPVMIGARLLENGIRYGAVLGLSAANPFFTGTRLALNRAATTASPKDTTVYDVLYGRFLVHYGLFVAEALNDERDAPPATTHFETALAGLTMAFTDRIAREARKAPASFRTPEFSSYALATLSLARVARLWQLAVPEDVLDQLGQIQVHKQHDGIRRALYAILRDENAVNEDQLQNAFRSTFHVHACKGVFIANLQFTHAYACSLARFGGRPLTALTHLLHD